jgi:hypothetical protein
MSENLFEYAPSISIGYRKCKFDSLLELKFVLAIESNWYFLRSHIQIYYDALSLRPTNYIRESTKKYTPDFLIRNKKGTKAWLVELKPEGFNNEEQLSIRKKVTDNYIKMNHLDWGFLVIYDNQFSLTRPQRNQYCRLRSQLERFNLKSKMEWMDKKWNVTNQNYFKTVPTHENSMSDAEYVRFVKFGHRHKSNAFYKVLF